MNCAFIVRKDQEATNGIVHVVDSILDPATMSQSDLVDLVLQVRSCGRSGCSKHPHLYRTVIRNATALLISMYPFKQSYRDRWKQMTSQVSAFCGRKVSRQDVCCPSNGKCVQQSAWDNETQTANKIYFDLVLEFFYLIEITHNKYVISMQANQSTTQVQERSLHIHTHTHTQVIK